MGNYDFELDLESQNTMSIINQWILPESNVLEFGSANGRLTRHLAQKKNCAVTVVEIDPQTGRMASQYAKQSFLGEEFGDIEKYYWENVDEKFDYIVFADVLEHLRNPKEVLCRCKRILRPEGKILVSIPNVTHNSIIIHMLKDEFEYADTGLLDRTHVHFFSYKSFCKMIQSCGIGISEMTPVYSRVGNNEISNTYSDVPIDVERYLRKRAAGAVYQYVFSLVAEGGKKEAEVKGLEIEAHGELETQCFFKGEQEEGYQSEQRATQRYFENEVTDFVIDLGQWQDVRQIRWDPFEYNGIILLDRCCILDENKDLKIVNSNARLKQGKLIIFDLEDPWIEFEEIEPKYRDKKLMISFRVLAYRQEPSYYETIFEMLGQFNDRAQCEFYASAILEDQIRELKEYVAHLEKDIEQLKLIRQNSGNIKQSFCSRVANIIRR